MFVSTQWFKQIKKRLQTLCLQPFYPLSGAYRNRTDDLLTAREITSVTYPLKIKYITNTQERKKQQIGAKGHLKRTLF